MLVAGRGGAAAAVEAARRGREDALAGPAGPPVAHHRQRPPGAVGLHGPQAVARRVERWLQRRAGLAAAAARAAPQAPVAAHVRQPRAHHAARGAAQRVLRPRRLVHRRQDRGARGGPARALPGAGLALGGPGPERALAHVVGRVDARARRLRHVRDAVRAGLREQGAPRRRALRRELRRGPELFGGSGPPVPHGLLRHVAARVGDVAAAHRRALRVLLPLAGRRVAPPLRVPLPQVERPGHPAARAPRAPREAPPRREGAADPREHPALRGDVLQGPRRRQVPGLPRGHAPPPGLQHPPRPRLPPGRRRERGHELVPRLEGAHVPPHVVAEQLGVLRRLARLGRADHAGPVRLHDDGRGRAVHRVDQGRKRVRRSQRQRLLSRPCSARFG